MSEPIKSAYEVPPVQDWDAKAMLPPLEKLTCDELLVILIEECAEIIQAATKCQRFGFMGNHVESYGRNDYKLAYEIGDLLGVVNQLVADGQIHEEIAAEAARTKIGRALEAKRMYEGK